MIDTLIIFQPQDPYINGSPDIPTHCPVCKSEDVFFPAISLKDKIGICRTCWHKGDAETF